MRLIEVEVFLAREARMQKGEAVDDDNTTPVLSDFQGTIPKYAILSHRWINDEVDYKTMVKLARMKNRNKIRDRSSYKKIVESCQQAEKDEIKWLWADTCCIDKRNSTELSEALNSMFLWYQNSKKCYAYLHDVAAAGFPTACDTEMYPGSNGWPEWFSRGWTLQELIAPTDLQFFNKGWESIGKKRTLASTLETITRVPSGILEYGLASYRPSVAQVMSWAADRKTTRVEDRAYSLMGLVGVKMPMLYGEGNEAFVRLQQEIMRKSNDQTIFAWNPTVGTPEASGMLADDPSLFRACHDIVQIELGDFNSMLFEIPPDKIGKTGIGYRYISAVAFLCSTVTDIEAPYASALANAEIHMRLPLRRYPGNHLVSKVALACRKEGDSTPITIDVVHWGSRCYRFTGKVGWHPLPGSYRYAELILAYGLTDAPSGIVINEPRGVAALLLEGCANKTGIVDDRSSQPFSVTRAEIDHSVGQRSPILIAAILHFHVATLCVSPLLFPLALYGRLSWFACGEVLLLSSTIFWMLSEVLTILPITFFRTANAPSPRGYILKSGNEIVVLKGEQHAVTSITHGETIFSLWFLRRLRLLTVILLLIAFAIFVKVCTGGDRVPVLLLGAQSLTIYYLEAIWVFQLWKLPRSWALIRILCRPKLTKYTFGTRTSAVVLTLLILRAEEAEEVMSELLRAEEAEKVMSELLLAPDSRALKKWKTIVLDHIGNGKNFDFGDSWDDDTWTHTEKENMNKLFQDAQHAYGVFKKHFAKQPV